MGLAVAALLAFNGSPVVHAEDTAARAKWAKDHPRRHELNKRLNKQAERIHEERKEGDLTKAQAQQLHAEDHAIRQQERADAAQHGGHITKAEQKQLNQEENAVSRQIPQ